MAEEMAEDGQEKKETVTISGVPVRTLRQFCFDKAAEFFKNDPDMIKLAREEINNMTEMERTCFHFDIQNEEEARGFLMFDDKSVEKRKNQAAVEQTDQTKKKARTD